MIKYKRGDLVKAALSGEVDVLVHQCNCFNNMGKGIAPQIARAFPDAAKIDKETVKGSKEKLGTYSVSHVNKVCSVVNLYGQYGYWPQPEGRINTDYTALEKGLQLLGDVLRSKKPNARVGLPKIGCGLGGGDWVIVSELIERAFIDLDITVYEL